MDTFVLVHGFGASSFSWRHWAPALAKRGRVLLVDLKGFGSASKPDDGVYGPMDQARLVEELIEAEGLARVTLIGHSFGGGVALLTALSLVARSDGPLDRLVLVAGAAYPQRLPPFVTLARVPRLTKAALAAIGAERVIRHTLRSIVRDRSVVDSEQIEAYAAPLKTSAGVRAMLDSARQIVPHDLAELTAQYPRIDKPTLLLWGRHDPVVPLSVGVRLSQELPAAQLHVMEECGHIPHEEHPAASLAVLEAFLNEA